MDFTQPTYVYQTNHKNSQYMSTFLAQGFNAQIVPPVAKFDGIAIGYGILRGVGEILQQAHTQGTPYLYCDHSFFKQSRANVFHRSPIDYYRLIKNGRYVHSDINRPSDRFENLKIDMKPWRTEGKHIVVVPMSNYVATYLGVNSHDWTSLIVQNIASLSKRDIIIKPKDSEVPLAKTLENAWCLVTKDSNAAVEAAIAGIPVFSSVSAASAPIANVYLNNIDDPEMPDREQWAFNLAYQQFTVEEIASGYAKQVLTQEPEEVSDELQDIH